MHLLSRRVVDKYLWGGQADIAYSGCLLWNSNFDVNVVVAIAIAINPGDSFSSHANLLVSLNPRGNLQRKESSGTPWFLLPKSKPFHYTKAILKELLKKVLHLGF